MDIHNAGKPKLIGKRINYNLSGEIFAKEIEQCIDAGATMVGGCCGTSPEHIISIRDILYKKLKKEFK